MALCERGLDRTLTLEQPVERGVEFVLADVARGQLDAEARGGGGEIERFGGGELGGRRDDAADDHGQDEVARAVGFSRSLRHFGPNSRSRTSRQTLGQRPAKTPREALFGRADRKNS